MTIRHASKYVLLLSAPLCRQTLPGQTGTAGTIGTNAGSDALFTGGGEPAISAQFRTFLFRRILSAGSLLGLSWLAGLLGPSPALAADYYVSPSGSDSSPGTLSQPFQTIQKAASVMVAGDTAFIRAGIYRETVTPANSGTQNAPITYMPYNGESVTVSGAGVMVNVP